MRKIHVVTQKELIRENDLVGCIAIVIDVFLATSTITFLLNGKYEKIYPTKDLDEARFLANRLGNETLLLGEINANPVKGFVYPDPFLIKKAKGNKLAVISSTNGTVAIENSIKANKLFVSSLTNGHMVAKELKKSSDNESIVIVCSGNAGSFSLEDMVGAGQLIHKLLQYNKYDLSDSAIASLNMYENSEKKNFNDLLDTRTARLLESKGYGNSTTQVLNNIEMLDVLPFYENGKIINHKINIDIYDKS